MSRTVLVHSAPAAAAAVIRPSFYIVNSPLDVSLQLSLLAEDYSADKWKDPISGKLRACCQLLKSAIEQPDFMKQFEVVKKRIEEILSDFAFPGQLVEDPMLDGQWLWSQAVLERYNALGEKSPFDKKTIRAKVHEFAKAVLQKLSVFLKAKPKEEILPDQQWVLMIKARALAYQKKCEQEALKVVEEDVWATVKAVEERVEKQIVELAEQQKKRNDEMQQKIETEALEIRLAALNKEKEQLATKLKGLETTDASLQTQVAAFRKRFPPQPVYVHNYNSSGIDNSGCHHGHRGGAD